MTKIPLMLIPIGSMPRIAKKLMGVSKPIARAIPQLDIELSETELDIKEEEYIAYSIISSIATTFFFAFIITVALLAVNATQQQKIFVLAVYSPMVFMILMAVLLSYPHILAGKKAEMIDRDLIYALKDLLLEISSGSSNYKALCGCADAGHGVVSDELQKVVEKVNVGMPVDDALEELALKVKSENMRKAIWQIVNAMRSGSSLENILREITRELMEQRKNKIKNYAQELNIMVLVYMLFAVVIPTIATTLIIVLGPFMGLNIGERVFYIVLPICFSIQIGLVKYIKSRRPAVYI